MATIFIIEMPHLQSWMPGITLGQPLDQLCALATEIRAIGTIVLA
jgi:hypothetical protein